jgi:hypothetical protein
MLDGIIHETPVDARNRTSALVVQHIAIRDISLIAIVINIRRFIRLGVTPPPP